MINRRGLGRGLDSLIPVAEEPQVGENSSEIALDDIVPNRFQPRKEFDQDKLNELAESIRQYGILQPIVLRKTADKYELVAGERRWRASRIAQLTTVPALVRELTDQEMTAIALVENLQREDLNAMEEARAYRQLMDEFGLTQEEVARKLNRSRAAIANSVRLLNLPEPIQDYVSRGTLSPGQVRPLLVLPTSELQVEAAEEIISGHMNAREAEDLSRKLQQRKIRPKAKKEKPAATWLRETEEKLSRRLGTRVHVVAEDEERGTLSIEFYSAEDLQRIIDLIDESSDQQLKSQNSAAKSISV